VRLPRGVVDGVLRGAREVGFMQSISATFVPLVALHRAAPPRVVAGMCWQCRTVSDGLPNGNGSRGNVNVLACLRLIGPR